MQEVNICFFSLIFFTSFPLIGMDHQQQKDALICQLNSIKQQKSVMYKADPVNLSEDCQRLDQRLVVLIEGAGNLLTYQEKFKFLRGGDHVYEYRKNIIKRMIVEEKTNPNTIVVDILDNTPLSEAISYCDVEFTHWLIQQGASPENDQKAKEFCSNSNNPAVRLLELEQSPIDREKERTVILSEIKKLQKEIAESRQILGESALTLNECIWKKFNRDVFNLKHREIVNNLRIANVLDLMTHQEIFTSLSGESYSQSDFSTYRKQLQSLMAK